MLKLGILIIVFGMMMHVQAFALNLSSAKDQGLVGEQPNGYLGVVGAASGEVSALIDDINRKRRVKYQEISAKNGKALSVVEKLAAGKAFKHTRSGNYIKKSGGWVKK